MSVRTSWAHTAAHILHRMRQASHRAVRRTANDGVRSSNRAAFPWCMLCAIFPQSRFDPTMRRFSMPVAQFRRNVVALMAIGVLTGAPYHAAAQELYGSV